MSIFDQTLQQYQTQFPVPVVDIARALGIKTYLDNSFPDSKSGEIVRQDGGYQIYLNAKHPYVRTRFTLAHELAHYKLHRDLLDRQQEIEDYDGQTASISLRRDKGAIRDNIELEADQEAARILMPEAKFIEVWNDRPTIEQVAKFFEVSTQAAEIRARTLALRG